MRFRGSVLFALIVSVLLVAGCCSSTETNPPPGASASGTTVTTRVTTPPPSATATVLTATRTATTPISDRTFMELIEEDMIEVTASGSDIETVRMSIENREEHSISFTIPVGTFLDSGGASYQSMVTIRDHEVSLEPHEIEIEWVDAACADIELKIPESDDSYGSVRTHPSSQLVSILRSLDESGASYDTKQAAVWIMTDNADWDDLGTLVSGIADARQIDEDEAARAMRAIDQGGMDITSKAIWADRRIILAGLTDASLKSWLENKG